MAYHKYKCRDLSYGMTRDVSDFSLHFSLPWLPRSFSLNFIHVPLLSCIPINVFAYYDIYVQGYVLFNTVHEICPLWNFFRETDNLQVLKVQAPPPPSSFRARQHYRVHIARRKGFSAMNTGKENTCIYRTLVL